jgi:hypothetical protein
VCSPTTMATVARAVRGLVVPPTAIALATVVTIAPGGPQPARGRDALKLEALAHGPTSASTPSWRICRLCAVPGNVSGFWSRSPRRHGHRLHVQ